MVHCDEEKQKVVLTCVNISAGNFVFCVRRYIHRSWENITFSDIISSSDDGLQVKPSRKWPSELTAYIIDIV
jgi:hypothetical protein